MIKVRIIKDTRKIRAIFPQCRDLAQKASFLPFHQLELSLTWWENFHSLDGFDFGKRRGKNFFGLQSAVNDYILFIAEKNGTLVGAAPFVFVESKIAGEKTPRKIMTFPGDSVLVPYQDFLVLPGEREQVIQVLFEEAVKFSENNEALLFLSYIPDNSPNIDFLKKQLDVFIQKGYEGVYLKNRRRGGVHPWTIRHLTFQVGKMAEKIASAELDELGKDLQKTTAAALFFPKTRASLQSRIQSAIDAVSANELVAEEIKNIRKLIEPADIVYPYLELPDSVDAYLSSLSKGTRRYFRRYKKHFIEQGGSFEKLTGEQIAEKDVQDYLDLHFQRWQEESAALNEMTRAFHLESSLRMAGLNRFTLFFAKHNGRRIAAHSCFDIGKRREGYFTGRDPEKEELRAGRLLYLETILDAIKYGFTEYNFGYGGDSYKLSFTDTVGKTVHFLLTAKGNMPKLKKLYPKYELLDLNAEGQG